jgi:hypothetical protein
MMHPQPIIQAQLKGEELPNQNTKIEYQLRTNTGVVASSFDRLELVQPYIDSRDAKWGNKAPSLALFRVTTITEKM